MKVGRGPRRRVECGELFTVRGKQLKRLRAVVAAWVLAAGMAGCAARWPVVVGDTDAERFTLTPAGGPLPDDALRAVISLPFELPKLEAGKKAVLSVVVKNAGARAWPALAGAGETYRVKLGNHWLDREGRTLVTDDGRAGLPYDLPPGAEAELLLTVTAPQTPGDYVLELDMVQEQVAWFAGKGSQPLRVRWRID